MAGAKDKGNQRFLTHERILGRNRERTGKDFYYLLFVLISKEGTV